MARIRSVKPELRRDLTAAEWPREVRYAWVLLWGYLDDHGRGLDDMRLIVADLFPLDRDVTEKKLDGWLNLMAARTIHGDPPLCRYEVAGRSYIHAPKWVRSQRVSHPQDSKCPACPVHDGGATRSVPEPDSFANQSGTDPTDFATSRTPADLGSKGAREQGADAVGDPPRIDVEQVCQAVVASEVAKGNKKPSITKAWRNDARLMLDSDDRPLAEVLDLIAWTTDHKFWRSNIRSVPKLREKYDTLRLQKADERPTVNRDAQGRICPPGQESLPTYERFRQVTL